MPSTSYQQLHDVTEEKLVDARTWFEHGGEVVRMERNRLYDSASDYFRLNGHAIMKLTPDAALEVCLEAAQHGLLVVRIEGGIWHASGFEARLDCIWDGADPPIDLEKAMANNARAAEDIRRERAVHSAFIISTAPLTGYCDKRT